MVVVVVDGASLAVCTAGVGADDKVVVVPVAGALDKYFCFISSAVKGAPVLRIPEPVELSEPVLESEEALLVAVGCASCAEVLLATEGLLSGSSGSLSRSTGSLEWVVVNAGAETGGWASSVVVSEDEGAFLFCFLILDISSSSLTCLAAAAGAFLT